MHKKSEGIVFFDIDGPIMRGLMQESLVIYLARRKLIAKSDVARILFGLFLYKLKIVEDPVRLFELGIEYARDKSTQEVDMILEDFLDFYTPSHFLLESETIIREHTQAGRSVYLLSSVIEPLAVLVGKRLRVPDVIATRLETVHGMYTGRILGPIMHGTEKLSAASLIVNDRHADWQNVWAYADDVSDIPLLSHCGHPIAANPSNALEKIAHVRDWKCIEYANTA